MPDNFQWTDELVAEYSLQSQKLTLWDFKRKKLRDIKAIEDYAKRAFENSIPKEPLFTTEDGVEIFVHDRYFSVNKDFKHSGQCNGFAWYNPESGYKYFSTKEKAEEYILLNKPIEVSLREFLEEISLDSTSLKEVRAFFKSKINP